jgi:hypothetical protein
VVRGPSLGGRNLTSKPVSAEAILAHVLKKLGWTSRYHKGLLNGHEHLRLLEAVKAFSRSWIKHEAEQFARSHLDWEEVRSVLGASEDEQVGRSLREQAGRFFKRIKNFVRESIVAGAMGLVGPRALTSDELQQAERHAQVQDAYLDRFQAELTRPWPFSPDKTIEALVSPPAITTSQFIARAESYGSCVWGYAQEIARASYARRMVFDQERRVLDDVKHCRQCPEYAARGWQKIGSLPAIGQDCDCHGGCRCSFEFRLGDKGDVFTAGRGPLDENTYGRTG